SSPPRVGLVWAGDPGNRMDRLRSCPATALRPLFDRVKDAGLDIAWTGLQLGPPAADLPDLPAALAPGGDFAATARVVAALDLVIGVDTAVIHLAGGLGVETWVMLAYVPDYRWMMDRDDSPWYPSARLFRQSRRGDWRGVIAQVAAALTKRFG
ncbi:hypothetical protein CCR92_02860, partial [Rhodospirillum rubrum]|nr:hypothetical protein [Rhodospirillum rubrum]